MNFQEIEKTVIRVEEIIKQRKIKDVTRLTIIKRKLSNLKRAISNVLPNIPTRTKRGIFNPMGTFIKSITGNLDQNDFETIQNSISRLDNGQYEIVNHLNEQVKINAIIINRFEDITTTVNNLSTTLQNYMRDSQHSEQKLLEDSLITQTQLLIEDNILNLSEQTNEIHEILTFAKVNIISRHILDNTEMNYVTDELLKNNIKIKSEEQIYSLLNLKAYYNNTDLVVLIEIPQFLEEKYNYYKIKTFPINNYIIEQATNILITNNQTHMLIYNSCQVIEQVYYCEKGHIYTNTDTCIPKILNNEDANCKTIQTTESDEIELLHDEYLFISSQQGIQIFTTCNPKQAIIKGIKLLRFQNCTIEINNKSYASDQIRRIHGIQVFQPFDNIFINATREDILDLPKLTRQTIENIKEINHHQERTTTYAHSIATSTSIIIIIIIIILLFRKYRSIKNLNSMQTNDTEDSINLGREELSAITKHATRASTSRST